MLEWTHVNDGFIAVRAARRELCVVIPLTVRSVVALEELACSELYLTADTDEVLGMPGLA